MIPIKPKLTFEEMAAYYSQENPLFQPTRYRVGKFAKAHGYRYTQQQVNKKLSFFYIKESNQ